MMLRYNVVYSRSITFTFMETVLQPLLLDSAIDLCIGNRTAFIGYSEVSYIYTRTHRYCGKHAGNENGQLIFA